MEQSAQPQFLGRYIVADPEICQGKPTFRGTRIMVFQVLNMVAKGLAWDIIIERCHDSITHEAIAEAVLLANKTFIDHVHEYRLELAVA